MKKTLFLTMMLTVLVSCNTGNDDKAIIETITAHRPLKGAEIPADIASRLGATHVGGKYFFTDKP
ncbi:MAG: hypothetical protein ACM3NP_02010, partial [Actinomycetota bacterium]